MHRYSQIVIIKLFTRALINEEEILKIMRALNIHKAHGHNNMCDKNISDKK